MTTMKKVTRLASEVWLVGQQLPILNQLNCSNQLPTSGQVLRRLFHDLKTKKLALSESCSNTVDEVIQIWQAANIPTTQKRNAVTKLKSLYDKYGLIHKNKGRRTDRQIEIEEDFISLLDKLFDVAHADCKDMIKIKEDWTFLEDQRGPRKMMMTQEDLEFKRREERRQKRVRDELKRQEKAKQSTEMTVAVEGFGEGDLEESDKDGDGDAEFADISKYHRYKNIPSTDVEEAAADKPKLQKRCIVDDELFVASLDRTNTTPYEAMHIVAPAFKAAGVDVSDITLSTSSIYRARKKARQSIADSQKQNFVPNTALIAHFDGKMLPDCTGNFADRMPVVVSGLNVEKLLAIPILPASTGELMGNAVVETLREWQGVPEYLAGLCFDTTSANTGIHTGAITVIQKALDKRLLFLACRHHMLETVSAATFDWFFKSSRPQIGIFSRFKEKWPFMNQADFEPMVTVSEQSPSAVSQSDLSND